MKITEILAHPLSAAYAQPRWTAHERMERDQIVLVEVRTGPRPHRIRRNCRRAAEADLRSGPHFRRSDQRHGPAGSHRDLGETVLADLAAARRNRRLGRHAGAAAAQPASADHGGDRRHRHRAVGPQGQGGQHACVPPARRHAHRDLHLLNRRVLSRRRAAGTLCRGIRPFRRRWISRGEAEDGRVVTGGRGHADPVCARGDRARREADAGHECAIRCRWLYPLRRGSCAVRYLLAGGAAALVPPACRLRAPRRGITDPTGALRTRMAPLHGSRLHRFRRDRLRAVRLELAPPASPNCCASRTMRSRRVS